MHLLLDYGLMWVGSLGLVAASVAAFVYVPAPFKRWDVEACVGLLLLVLSFSQGFSTMKARCDAASAAYQAQIVARDATISNQSQQLDAAQKTARDAANRKTVTEVDDYEKHLPADSHCGLSDADARRLRDIR